MRVLLCVCLAMVVGCFSSEEEWKTFKKTYGRQFYSHKDELARKEIFEENLKTIQRHNLLYSRGLQSFEMAVNKFSDMTADEVNSMLNGYKGEDGMSGKLLFQLADGKPKNVPQVFDWRPKGVVTPVKNQGNCGSCWAFSSTGSIEGAHAIKTGKLVSLSEQNLVDCSKANFGCQGGWMWKSFAYIIANGGIDTEESYPYKAVEQKSCYYRNDTVGATLSGYKFLERGNEEKLKEAVAIIGPISVGIDASLASFQSYHRGIYEDPRCNSVRSNHAVLVVGYGAENGRDYWIVKNSWGEDWGENGYIRMIRNKNNNCGIASSAVYPII